jgi:hypothetical protein
MPIIVDVFSEDAFSAVELTRSVNIVPNTYGRLQELNLFPAEPIATTSVAIAFENGQINLLPTRQRGGPPSLGAPERRNARVFDIPHIPHDDFVMAADVQNRIAFGGAGGMESVVDLVNRKLMRMRRKHAITLEFMRMGALRGQVLDYDGSVIRNYFTEFGVTEKTVEFDLDVDATNVASKTREVVAYMEDNLLGDTMTGVHALCAPDFFEDLITHPMVTETYKYFAAVQNPLRDDVRRGFSYHGVTFEEHRGSASQLNEDGTTTARKFIPDGTARFFPVGTMETFATYFAPPDILDEVNAPPGTEVYAAQAIDPEFARHVKLHTQSNPLPVVKRPNLLVKGNK